MRKTTESSSVVRTETKKRRRMPADTIEGRENQLIAMSYDLVERHIREGTATSQELTHFLKLGSTKEKLERELLEIQKELMKAKKEQLNSQVEMKEIMKDAMAALKSYAPQS